MIIDVILDRYHHYPREYTPEYFFDEVSAYSDVFPELATPILSALLCNEESAKLALCNYIGNEYNPKIKDFINAVNWCTPCASNDTNIKI